MYLLRPMFYPRSLLKKILQKRNIWKQYCNYAEARRKWVHGAERCAFLRKCKDNDIIPSFLRFRIPDKNCFDDNSVHCFQKRLLRKELSSALNILAVRLEGVDETRSKLKSLLPDHLRLSVTVHSRRQVQAHRNGIRIRHQTKLQSLSERQEKPISRSEGTVVNLSGLHIPRYVYEILAQCREMHFLADMDQILAQIPAEDSERKK